MTDPYSVFLRTHILLAMAQPKLAIESYLAMLIRASVSQKLGSDLIVRVIEGRKASLSTSTMLVYVEMLQSYGLKD
jgi:hypothetical protein